MAITSSCRIRTRNKRRFKTCLWGSLQLRFTCIAFHRFKVRLMTVGCDNMSYECKEYLTTVITAMVTHTIIQICIQSQGAGGSVVAWGTMLQAGRWPVRVPDEVDFFNLTTPSSRIMALGSTQPLPKVNTRNLSGGNSGGGVGLTTFSSSMSRISENVGASTSRNPKGLHFLYRDNFTFTSTHITLSTRAIYTTLNLILSTYATYTTLTWMSHYPDNRYSSTE
jgi:hypothetical protein